jgi:hypothetical protein
LKKKEKKFVPSYFLIFCLVFSSPQWLYPYTISFFPTKLVFANDLDCLLFATGLKDILSICGTTLPTTYREKDIFYDAEDDCKALCYFQVFPRRNM